MRLTLSIVVLHILHRGKRRLNRDIEALVPGVVERLADGSCDDIRLSVLRELALTLQYTGDEYSRGGHTLVAVLASTLYCSSRRSRSASLGTLKRVMRSIGAMVTGDVEIVRAKSVRGLALRNMSSYITLSWWDICGGSGSPCG